MDVFEIFTIILCSLGAVLLIVLIVLGFKIMGTVDRINNILDDSYKKIQSLNGVFDVIDNVTDTLSSLNDKLVGTISSVFGKFLKKKNKKKKENDLDE